MKKVKFRTTMFGLLPRGSIIDLFCLGQDDPVALLYAPSDKDGCGCLIWAKLGRDGIYEDDYKHNFINQGTVSISKEFLSFLKKMAPAKRNKRQSSKAASRKLAN